MIYFLKGKLPWQGLKGASKQRKYDAILERKITTSVPQLCSGLPDEFSFYIDYVKKLKFEEQPDYHKLRQMLRDAFVRHNYVFDYGFDWILIKQEVAYFDVER